MIPDYRSVKSSQESTEGSRSAMLFTLRMKETSTASLMMIEMKMSVEMKNLLVKSRGK
jgi:hypothetical protein